MRWYLSSQTYSMPSVLDLSSEASPNLNSEPLLRQDDYTSLGQDDYTSHDCMNHQNPSGDRYTGSSFPYISPGADVPGYYQPQYTCAYHNQQQSYSDNTFVWIGANNYYPASSYDQRCSEQPYNPQRQNLRRYNASERIEKTSNRKRRAPTVAQRRAANIRERRRMYNLNEAFDCLRQRIPTFAYEKRLSRIETLRLAISYISFMARIVNGEDPSTLRVNTYPSLTSASSSLTQSSLHRDSAAPLSADNDDFDEDRDEDEDEEGEDDDISGADDEVTDDDSCNTDKTTNICDTPCETQQNI
ncbi:unnamed protein product [Candidula unifasciata]|uniref:BHLH domain-containing protein n=1 Tax=Candidula unifasciata TaxID=100452 RepID=A0A8S3Z0U3_9EUPU|nr:unnamed protein product [Candidula unifasciata]